VTQSRVVDLRVDHAALAASLVAANLHVGLGMPAISSNVEIIRG
jgi:hypothetical protein